MRQNSPISSDALEWIRQQSTRFSATDIERMRSSLPSRDIQRLVERGLQEKEAIWLLSWHNSIPEASPDDPIWNDRTFRLSYRMPSGRMEPLVVRYRPTPSSDSEAPPDSTA